MQALALEAKIGPEASTKNDPEKRPRFFGEILP